MTRWAECGQGGASTVTVTMHDRSSRLVVASYHRPQEVTHCADSDIRVLVPAELEWAGSRGEVAAISMADGDLSARRVTRILARQTVHCIFNSPSRVMSKIIITGATGNGPSTCGPEQANR